LENDISGAKDDLERLIVVMQKEISEKRNAKAYALEEDKRILENKISEQKKILEERNSTIRALQAQIAEVVHAQENEATNTSLFIHKSINSIQYTVEAAQKQGNKNFVIESQANLGFANLTISSHVK